ncbi:MAG TPA: hypothetical protein PKK56_00095 [archaeon]|jgi:hypothetical protein|nr:hypothetical protein [archaeon]HRT02446.1 hypothetical protein [Candidatus Diapherotrites archaeon]
MVNNSKKIKANFVKYKFKFNNDVNRVSYLYQKVFRSIYGYTQNVTKSDKKVYIYYRKGVVSDIPYIKQNKNTIILPKGYENKLIEYFETGKNPAHDWKIKGDWGIEYSIDEIEVDSNSVIKSLEDHIQSLQIIDSKNNYAKLVSEINNLLDNNSLDNNNQDYINYINDTIQGIINNEWFKETYTNSEILNGFYNNYQKFKQKYNL